MATLRHRSGAPAASRHALGERARVSASCRAVPSKPWTPGAASGAALVLDAAPARRRRHCRAEASGVVVGAPGTGKTTALVARVAALVEAGVDPDALLVLTPSRQTATALRDRLALAVGRATSGPLARSVASFAYQLVRATAVAAGDEPPQLLTGGDEDQLIQDLLDGDAEDEADGLRPLAGVARRRPSASTKGFRTEVRTFLAECTTLGIESERLRALGDAHAIPVWAAMASFLAEYLQVRADMRGAHRDAAGLVREAVGRAAHRARRAPRSLDRIAVDPRGRRAGADARRRRAARGLRARAGSRCSPSATPTSARVRSAAPRPRTSRGCAASLGARVGARRVAPRHGLAERARPAGHAAHRSRRRRRASRRRRPMRRPTPRCAPSRCARPPRSSTRSRACCASGTCTTASPWSRVRRDRARHAPGHGARGGARRPRGADALERPRPAARHPRAGARPAAAHRPGGARRVDLRRRGRGAARDRRPPRPDRAAAAALGAAPPASSPPGGERSGRELLVSAMQQPLEFDLIDTREARRAAALAARRSAVLRDDLDRGATAHELLWTAWDRSGLERPWSELARGHGPLADQANRDLDAVVALFQAAKRFVERSLGRRPARVRARHPRQRRRRRPPRRARRAATRCASSRPPARSAPSSTRS